MAPAASPISGSAVSLRPSGISRYFAAAFLSLWLVGWVIGETFALGMLGMLLGSLSGAISEQHLPLSAGEWLSSGAAGFVILFLLVWVTFWTVGGIAAITQLLRTLAGADDISVHAGGIELVRRGGPFHRVRTFDRRSIRRVRMRHRDAALVADTASGTQVLTEFGTREERQAIHEWLRRQLGLDGQTAASDAAPPAGWEVTAADGGGTSLRKVVRRTRRARAVLAWLVMVAVSLGWFASLSPERPIGSIPALVLTLLTACGAALTSWGRREWIVRPGQLTYRRRFAMWEWEQTFTNAHLEVTLNTDSDSDDHFSVVIKDGGARRTLHSEMNDSGETTDFAQWLASRTGFILTLPRELRPRGPIRVSEGELR